MEFCWITLSVNNMEESLHFYRDLLDLPISRRFTSHEVVEIVMLGSEDSVKIELICNSNEKKEKKTEGFSIGFEVASLADAMSQMKNNGIQITKGPFSPNPKINFCYVNDPDGYDVQLVENS